jgi:hypothetical protein
MNYDTNSLRALGTTDHSFHLEGGFPTECNNTEYSLYEAGKCCQKYVCHLGPGNI